MTRPSLSRRHALALASLSAAGGASLAACARVDQGFGTPGLVGADDDGAVPLDSIPENATTLVNFGGQQPFVAIVRGSGEDITAFSGYCTHNGCALADQHGELHCPCHGSGFDEKTGEVLRGPASEHLPTVSVIVKNGEIRRG